MDRIPLMETVGAWHALTSEGDPAEKMPPLEEADLQYMRSAEGWLELGNPHLANEELDHITPEQRVNTDVLLLRWQIFAHARMWTVCMAISRAITQRAAGDARGWVVLAETFYAMGQIADAYTIGFCKSLDFPGSWRLLYDTARYACLLGKTSEAEQCLQLAMAVGDSTQIRRRAAADPDLAGLWPGSVGKTNRKQRALN